MSYRRKAQDRAVRIELLRARAELERHSLSRYSKNLGEQLQPGRLLSHFSLPFGSGNMRSVLGSALSLSRRYPFLLSGASTLLSTLGGRWVKVAALGLLGWKVLGAVQSHPNKAPNRAPESPFGEDIAP